MPSICSTMFGLKREISLMELMRPGLIDISASFSRDEDLEIDLVEMDHERLTIRGRYGIQEMSKDEIISLYEAKEWAKLNRRVKQLARNVGSYRPTTAIACFHADMN